MSRRFNKATGWIIHRRWLSVILLLLISAVATGGYYAPGEIVETIKAVIKSSFSSDDEVTEPTQTVATEVAIEAFDTPPENVEALNLSRADVIVVVQSDSFFTPEGSHAIRSVVRRLEQEDYIDDILWMDKVPTLNLFGLNEPLLPKRESAQERFDSARRKAAEHPLVNGQLLSADGKTLLLMIRIDFLFVYDDSPFLSGIRKIAEAEAANHPNAKLDFHVTGSVPGHLTIMKTHQDNQLKYQAIAYGMILLMSVILFRGITAVAVVAMAPFMGVFWTMGMVRYLSLIHI